MTTREPADWQRPSRTRLETVYETREESSEDPEDRVPAPMQRGDSAESMASTQPSTPTPTRKHERPSAGHDRESPLDNMEPECAYYLAMARGIRARQAAAAQEQAAAQRDGAPARDSQRRTSAPQERAPQDQPRVDDRPVRGVVTLQAHLSLTAADRPKRMLLIASRETLVVQTLEKPYRALTKIPIGDMAAGVVPGHDNMFRIWLHASPEEQDDGVVVVVVRDCSLRDQWLQALVTAGARVDVTSWHPPVGTTAWMLPPACSPYGFWNGAPPPVRWLR
jgi:hypothetical protein